MPLSHYLCCLWPGLPELWFRGRASALPAAICFAIALNTLLVARFIYPQWLEPLVVRAVFWGFVALWAVIFVRAARGLPLLLTPRHVAGVADCYESASAEFLKGRWFEAEALLVQCLEVDSRDALSLLLLASVYRKTDRFAAAGQTLDELASLETGDAWWLEREIEERRLKRAVAEIAEKQADDAAEQASPAKASSSNQENSTEQMSADVAESSQFVASVAGQG